MKLHWVGEHFPEAKNENTWAGQLGRKSENTSAGTPGMGPGGAPERPGGRSWTAGGPVLSMGQCDRSHLQDSKRGGESFWDGLGVEFEAKLVLDARVCVGVGVGFGVGVCGLPRGAPPWPN